MTQAKHRDHHRIALSVRYLTSISRNCASISLALIPSSSPALGTRIRIQDSGCWVQGSGFRAYGLGLKASGQRGLGYLSRKTCASASIASFPASPLSMNLPELGFVVEIRVLRLRV